MKHSFGLFIVLATLWLLLSGYFEPLLLGLGLASCLFVLFIAHRMDAVDFQGSVVRLRFFQMLLYWAWLIREIVKTSIAVTKSILSPNMAISPNIVKVTASEASDLGLVIYANSITLTPGTISIDITDQEITVHALTRDFGKDLVADKMDRRIAKLEASP